MSRQNEGLPLWLGRSRDSAGLGLRSKRQFFSSPRIPDKPDISISSHIIGQRRPSEPAARHPRAQLSSWPGLSTGQGGLPAVFPWGRRGFTESISTFSLFRTRKQAIFGGRWWYSVLFLKLDRFITGVRRCASLLQGPWLHFSPFHHIPLFILPWLNFIRR